MTVNNILCCEVLFTLSNYVNLLIHTYVKIMCTKLISKLTSECRQDDILSHLHTKNLLDRFIYFAKSLFFFKQKELSGHLFLNLYNNRTQSDDATTYCARFNNLLFVYALKLVLCFSYRSKM